MDGRLRRIGVGSLMQLKRLCACRSSSVRLLRPLQLQTLTFAVHLHGQDVHEWNDVREGEGEGEERREREEEVEQRERMTRRRWGGRTNVI